MTAKWKYPKSDPLFTDALIAEWVEAAKGQPRKAKAFDSRLRFSDSGACTAQLAFKDLDNEPDTEMDPAGIWVTGLGTLIHELLQAALLRRYPNARIEVKAVIKFTSGHCDAVVEIDGVRWLFELKTCGGFAYQKAIGLNRYKLENPQGPKQSAIRQASINALAHECEMVAIGYISLEAVSAQRAGATGLRQMDRILSEWHLTREEWEPFAYAELARQQAVLDAVDSGWLPEPTAPDDDGVIQRLNPLGSRVPWNCEYCGYRPRCEAGGAVARPINLEATA